MDQWYRKSTFAAQLSYGLFFFRCIYVNVIRDNFRRQKSTNELRGIKGVFGAFHCGRDLETLVKPEKRAHFRCLQPTTMPTKWTPSAQLI